MSSKFVTRNAFDKSAYKFQFSLKISAILSSNSPWGHKNNNHDNVSIIGSSSNRGNERIDANELLNDNNLRKESLQISLFQTNRFRAKTEINNIIIKK